MKVKELIKKLKELNPKASLTIHLHEGCHSLEDVFEIMEVDEYYIDDDISAFIAIDKGCMCHKGTLTDKFKKQKKETCVINPYWKARDEIIKMLKEDIERMEKHKPTNPETLKEMAKIERCDGMIHQTKLIIDKVDKMREKS